MKNSLFKRAIAAASVVPVALTQCLSIANVVAVETTAQPAIVKAQGETFTLDRGDATSLLYIAPEKDYAREGDVFTKSSNWNNLINTAVVSNAGKTGVLDLNEVYDKAVEASGKFSEVTENLIAKFGEISYEITEEGKIVVSGTLDNITPMYTEGGSNTVGGALRKMGLKYGVKDLVEPGHFFDDILIACDFTATLDASGLADDTTAIATLELKDAATGEIYKGEGAVDWALENFEALRDRAKEVCEDYAESINVEEANKEIDDSITFYIDKLKAVKAKYDEAKKCNETIEAANGRELALMFNDKVVVATNKNPLLFAYKNEAKAREIFKNALAQANEIAAPYAFDVEVDECIEFAQNVYDIKATYSDCVATFDAKFVDKEAAAVEKYIEANYNVEVVDVYKTVSVLADITNVPNDLGGFAIADMKYDRVVVVKDLEKTTTTTTTSDVPGGSTTTTTASDVPGGSTTTTTAGSDVPGGSTTTTTDSDVPGGSTTTTTDSDVPGGSTTTTTDSDVPGGSTTTTTDSDVPGGSTTTTTDSDVPGGSTTTTTGDPSVVTTTTTTVDPTLTTTTIEKKTVVNYYTETAVGFYLNTDEEFDIDRVKSITYVVEEHEISYGENLLVIEDKIVSATPAKSILDSIEFKDVPADVDKLQNENSVNQFAFQVQIYASKDIVTDNGFVVAKAGDKLTNADGKAVAATAYIGVKGDADLNMICDASDASIVLAWYANVSTGGEEDKFLPGDERTEQYDMLDEFAAFLADVDNENDSANSIMLKNQRIITSVDASYILGYYSKISTGYAPGKETWAEELGPYAKN